MDPKALYRIGYGMYVIGAHKGNRINAQIANTLFQISSEPPTLAVSINKKNLTNEFIRDSKAFAAAVLNMDTPLPFIGQFGFKSGRDVPKFEGVKYKIGVTGSPIVLDNAVSYLEVKVSQEVDAGTHSIFIGQVVEGEVLNEGKTLTYEYYQQVKRGTTPKTAPSYVPTPPAAAAAVAPATASVAPATATPTASAVAAPPPPTQTAGKYKCQVCGYIYDPAAGDPDGGIKPGTPFEEIPDTWTCPVCGADKSQFVKIE